MMKWNLKIMELKLNTPWVISRGQSNHKTNFIVQVTDGNKRGLGEVAANIRYGEDPNLIVDQFREFNQHFQRTGQITSNNCCQSLSFGIQSALTHFLEGDDNVAKFSCSQLERIHSVPLLKDREIPKFLNRVEAFPILKIKVGRKNPIGYLKKLASYSSAKLLVDANEAFEDLDLYLEFENLCQRLGVELIEQPFGSHRVDLYTELRNYRQIPVFADESLTNQTDLYTLSLLFDGVNIKLMKAGSYEVAIEQFKQAESYGLKTMLGCMIESGLGISSALRLVQFADYVDLDGNLFLQEDPFSNLLEETQYKVAV